MNESIVSRHPWQRIVAIVRTLPTIVGLALVGSGCSFINSHVPDKLPVKGHIDCPGISYPIIDTVFAVAGIGTSYYASTVKGHSDGQTDPPGIGSATFLVVGLPSLVIGVTELASAIYGYQQNERCRRLERLGVTQP